MGTRDLIGEVDSVSEAYNPSSSQSVVKSRPVASRAGARPDYSKRMTETHHSFSEGHPQREVFHTTARDAGDQAAVKVWRDFKAGEPKVHPVTLIYGSEIRLTLHPSLR
jgi:hypothetical protein